ncbi:CRISPR-associated endonuclease Cas2 [Varunaivibrio sulfuroxidans]|nr:CRISPR-associated endonuclease Cas2 [Varunaivibrio sulfuroxidans]WES29506.1 CRISPR-associated endonuclease Cas2 [Varunaivibrio sulfuroxidans]
MWLVVVFDLPVGTKTERRRASGFRNMLIDEGFMMKQFSVYLRPCQNRAAAESLADRIGKCSPPEGDVSVMFFTDKQYGLTRNYAGRAELEPEKKPDQFTLF